MSVPVGASPTLARPRSASPAGGALCRRGERVELRGALRGRRAGRRPCNLPRPALDTARRRCHHGRCGGPATSRACSPCSSRWRFSHSWRPSACGASATCGQAGPVSHCWRRQASHCWRSAPCLPGAAAPARCRATPSAWWRHRCGGTRCGKTVQIFQGSQAHGRLRWPAVAQPVEKALQVLEVCPAHCSLPCSL